MGKYLKMADVFVVDGDADFAVLLPMSVVPEYDDCVTPHDYATHAINTHDDLVDMNQELLEALEAAVECGMVPTSSATEGGAMRYVKQAHVADQIRAAIAKAKGGAV